MPNADENLHGEKIKGHFFYFNTENFVRTALLIFRIRITESKTKKRKIYNSGILDFLKSLKFSVIT